MSLTKDGYMPRLIDKKIEKYLTLFGAVSIEGPKWCGKTWSGLRQANSVTYMTEKSQRDLAKIDPKYIFQEGNPPKGIWSIPRLHARLSICPQTN